MYQTLRIFAVALSASFAQSATLCYKFEAAGSWGALQQVNRKQPLDVVSEAKPFHYVANKSSSLFLSELSINNILEKTDAPKGLDAVHIDYRTACGNGVKSQNTSRLEAIFPIYLPRKTRPSNGFSV